MSVTCRCVVHRAREVTHEGYRRAPLVDRDGSTHPFALAKEGCRGCHGTGVEGRARSSRPPATSEARGLDAAKVRALIEGAT